MADKNNQPVGVGNWMIALYVFLIGALLSGVP